MSSSPIIEKSPASPPDLGQTRNSPELNDPDPGSEHEQHVHGVEWAELVRIAFVAIAAAAVWFRLWEPFPHISVIGIVATLALLSALAIGEFFTALVITGFVLAAEVLEGLTVGRGRRRSRVFSIFSPELSKSAVMVR